MHELAGCRLLAAEAAVDGYVVDYADGVLRMQLEAPLVVQEVGDAVTVQVLDAVRGECTYRGLLARSLGTSVDVVVLESAGQRQRRSAARAPYVVTCIGVVGEDENSEQVPVTVLDVSATGLRFSSRRKLTLGAVVVVRLPAEGETLELHARVLRVEEARTLHRYGAELVDVDVRTQERLYRLVMRLQREELQRASDERS